MDQIDVDSTLRQICEGYMIMDAKKVRRIAIEWKYKVRAVESELSAAQQLEKRIEEENEDDYEMRRREARPNTERLMGEVESKKDFVSFLERVTKVREANNKKSRFTKLHDAIIRFPRRNSENVRDGFFMILHVLFVILSEKRIEEGNQGENADIYETRRREARRNCERLENELSVKKLASSLVEIIAESRKIDTKETRFSKFCYACCRFMVSSMEQYHDLISRAYAHIQRKIREIDNRILSLEEQRAYAMTIEEPEVRQEMEGVIRMSEEYFQTIRIFWRHFIGRVFRMAVITDCDLDGSRALSVARLYYRNSVLIERFLALIPHRLPDSVHELKQLFVIATIFHVYASS